ncbi:cGMP-specific 3',5'-cyclic phosphodiesterase-like isoform X1 [Tachypleus tridentatus]|uniref:cGMP-specific 3',5'-cyclic phosphodiesterase-like isoform X1 n=1 Tax=Tachypleus tridentatus TaxID=6853 RepID=UPI003FD1913F
MVEEKKLYDSPEENKEDMSEDDKEKMVSSYLATHPNFVREWFINFAPGDLVQELMKTQESIGQDEELILTNTQMARVGRNSVTSELFRDMLAGPRKRKVSQDMKNKVILKHQLRTLDENELLMELIRDIANELDIETLCHKILVNVSILTDSDRSSLFLAKGSRGQRYLVAKLFDVTANSVLEDALSAAVEDAKIPPIPFGVGIAGHVARTKETVNIKDAYQDPRFNKEIDDRTGYHTVSIMCMPILNFNGDVIGVAQCINKVSEDHVFSLQDEEVFRKYLTFCGIGIQNAQLFEMSVQEYKRNQLLLGLAKSIFEETSSLDGLINKIMVKTQGLLTCEKCRVYLIDVEQSSRVMYQTQFSTEKVPSVMKPRKFSKPQDVVFTKIFELWHGEEEIRTPSLSELSGDEATHVCFARHVAATGQTFNWTGNETDFNAINTVHYSCCVDNVNNTKPRVPVLSLPIFNNEENVIGVAQLVNKMKGEQFTNVDVKTVEAFSIFCGLGIHNTQVYESAMKLMAKQRVALEVLSYHASSSVEETTRLTNLPIPSAERFQLYSFGFSDFSLSNEQTYQVTLRMFKDLDLISKFHIPYQVLCRWVLSVSKNYRPVIYHNWRHALNVSQTMFAMITTGRMGSLMTDLEILALLVACLCHDLDHRGTNNSFQTKTDSPLAVLYSTSTMEHHHFDQSIMILNSEGNNIFQSLSPEEYKIAVSVIESAILSTDLALYFKKKYRFLELVQSGEEDWSEPAKKDLLRGMMMTACDVSAISKPWEVQKKIAELVASEFFEQGDLEKEHLKERPSAMMDREKKDELPQMQVGFIDSICMPVYKGLTQLQPALSSLLRGCESNRQNWQSLAEAFERQKASTSEETRNGILKIEEEFNDFEAESCLKENCVSDCCFMENRKNEDKSRRNSGGSSESGGCIKHFDGSQFCCLL